MWLDIFSRLQSFLLAITIPLISLDVNANGPFKLTEKHKFE